MESIHRPDSDATLASLEAAAASARAGFACVFSTSDEYERALICERRAQGRYGRQPSRWPAMMFVGCTLAVAGTVLLLNYFSNWIIRSRFAGSNAARVRVLTGKAA